MYKFILILISIYSSMISAQNLVLNPGFDLNIDHWDPNFNNFEWIDNDGGPMTGNGSLRFGRNLNNNASIFTTSEPIDINPNYHYLFGASIKIPSASTSQETFLNIYWYDENDNLISETNYSYFGQYPNPSDIWFNIDDSASSPANTSYAVFYLRISLGGDGSMNEAYALWDDVYFIKDTLFVSGFE